MGIRQDRSEATEGRREGGQTHKLHSVRTIQLYEFNQFTRQAKARVPRNCLDTYEDGSEKEKAADVFKEETWKRSCLGEVNCSETTEGRLERGVAIQLPYVVDGTGDGSPSKSTHEEKEREFIRVGADQDAQETTH